MGYWDRVTAQYFITADDGSRIFLPEFSRTGFILSGPEKEAAIARFIRRHHVAMFLLSPLAPVIAALIGISTTDWVYLPVVVVLVVAGYVLPYRYGIGSLTVGLPTQAVRISFWERQRNEARVQGKITLWIEELYTLALMLGGAWFTLTFFGPDEPLALAVGVAWVLVTGWSASVGVYQLVIIYCD